MNKYEQALVDAVRQITKDNAARAASDARWLNGMLRDLAPQVIGQREYKMLTALLNCEGNRILAEAAKKPAACAMNTSWMRTRRGVSARCTLPVSPATTRL